MRVLPGLLTYLEPATTALPERFPSPFAAEPCALARCAAELLIEELSQGLLSGLGHDFQEPGQGKMFGVLVVRGPEGRLAYLRAVSGMLAGSWLVPGFAPPCFDVEIREGFWPQGQRRLDALEAQRLELAKGPASQALGDRIKSQRSEHSAEREHLNREHLERRQERARAREQSGADLHALAEQSRADTRELRELRARHAQQSAALELERAALESQKRALRAERGEVSNQLLARIREGYSIRSYQGREASLGSIFSPEEPPGGAGDCAAPKLLHCAYRERVEPLALAEFWWGATPAGGGRHHGHFYPACRRKCGPLLPFMLEGLDVEEAPLYATASLDRDAPHTIYEDRELLVVHKPAGMLSVPGKGPRRTDSALTRLRARSAQPDLPLAVHRLDLDTSGLLLFAKSQEVHRQAQALFARRQVDKHYIAWLSGIVERERGRIALPLRVDLDDRPRQIVCAQHGKESVTEFEVLERRGAFTKVLFRPRSGRTHQLRVHASHPEGLNAPIVGDRLYGRPGPRLLLHAQGLRLSHPGTAEELVLHCDPEADFEPAG